MLARSDELIWCQNPEHRHPLTIWVLGHRNLFQDSILGLVWKNRKTTKLIWDIRRYKRDKFL